MAIAINAKVDTLYDIAYRDKATLAQKEKGELPSGDPVNKAAHEIIQGHKDSVILGKVFSAIGITLFVLGVVLASVYSSRLNAPSVMTFKLIRLGVAFIMLGCFLSGTGGWFWYKDEKAFEEDRQKPISEVAKRLGEDLVSLEQREYDNVFEHEAIMVDWKKLHDAAAPHYTKKF